jgi:sigma-54 dependent transcriptional regulator, acetoin dehydrogenase operon transcriptional activator AcoR
MDGLVLNSKNLELVLNNLNDGIIAHDLSRKIIFFNKAAEKITGYSRSEVIGRDCHEVFTGVPFCGERCSFCSEPSLFREPIEYSLTFITKSGESRSLEMSVSSCIDDDVLVGVIAVFRDMTEYLALEAKAGELTSFADIIGKEKVMLDLFQQIKEFAVYDYPVHIQGETGVGKERVASALHSISSRGGGAFIAVNCGAIPEGLVESELFGHVKGAFSGAIKERKGRFEMADKGTLFLDEVAELPLHIQVKLLRVLEQGTLQRVGGEQNISLNLRIISATNKDLAEEVKKGKFRKDLYYRLNVIPIKIPPLRDRRNDIPLLISHFLQRAGNETNQKTPEFSKDALRTMMDYHWPGNVRQLQNVIQFASVRCKTGKILSSDLPLELRMNNNEEPEYGSDERDFKKSRPDLRAVEEALRKTDGNKAKAARLLGIGRTTLYRYLGLNS